MTGGATSPQGAVKRASEHLQSIEAEVGRWREEHPYRSLRPICPQAGVNVPKKLVISEIFDEDDLYSVLEWWQSEKSSSS
jgi:hypothetical protein